MSNISKEGLFKTCPSFLISVQLVRNRALTPKECQRMHDKEKDHMNSAVVLAWRQELNSSRRTSDCFTLICDNTAPAAYGNSEVTRTSSLRFYPHTGKGGLHLGLANPGR